MKEIRIHGRGGQGVVLASEIFVGALIKEGKYATCFPFFGFERRGAPVIGFIRFDEKPIRQKDQIYHPDCVISFDGTLFKSVNIYQGIRENSIAILNESRDISELSIPSEVKKIGLVDATRISLEIAGTFIPNSAMLGALCRTTGWVDLSSLLKSIKETLPGKILQRNIRMVERAFEETREFIRGENGQWH